jgi:uncharacterized protein (DUF433 family)
MAKTAITRCVQKPRYEDWEITKPSGMIELVLKGQPEFIEEVNLDSWPVFIPREANEKLAWVEVRMWVGQSMLQDAIKINPQIRGGIPVLAGSRVTIAQIIGEIADGRSIDDLAESFDLDPTALQTLFQGLAINFDHSFLK